MKCDSALLMASDCDCERHHYFIFSQNIAQNKRMKRECATSIGYSTGTNILLFQPRYSSMSSTRPTLRLRRFRHFFLVYVSHFLRNSVLMTYIANVIEVILVINKRRTMILMEVFKQIRYKRCCQ